MCVADRSADGEGGRDVFVYFDNDAKVHAPFDALRLAERLRGPVQARSVTAPERRALPG
jgi:uncharacterized protein YecE (DUF72 family)